MTQESIWKDDKLDRQDLAKSFTKIIQSSVDMSDDALVIGLHAAYGMGKSFFLDKWRQQLSAEGYITVAFDAWENDYCGDPMVSFAAEVRGQLAKFIKGEKFNETLGRIAMAAIDQVPLLPNLIASEHELEDHLSVGRFGNALIVSYQNAKEGVSDFKKELSNIYAKSNKNNQKSKPIVVFIDELDRCRPNYSIELLEKIKHIFNVKGYVFVLGFDKIQLSKSIETIYGKDMDTAGYLRRFFNIELTLTEPALDRFVPYIVSDKYKFPQHVQISGQSLESDRDPMVESIQMMAHWFELKLRDIDRLAHQCRVLLGAVTANNTMLKPILPSVFVVLVALKLKYPEAYESICANCKTGEGAVTQMNQIAQMPKEFRTGEYSNWLLKLKDGLSALMMSEDARHKRSIEIRNQDNAEVYHLQRVRELQSMLRENGFKFDTTNQGMAVIKSLVDATYYTEDLSMP